MDKQQKGNRYNLFNFRMDHDVESDHQQVVFYELNNDGSFENGTTLEEMLRVSIERLQELNQRFFCHENEQAIIKMKEALMWLNARTADRVARGVEGKLEA